VVLAASAVRVASVSDAPQFGMDGQVRREWRRLALRDGVAVVTAPSGAHRARVRVARYDGPVVASGLPLRAREIPRPAGLNDAQAELVREFASSYDVPVQDVRVTSRRTLQPWPGVTLDTIVMRLPGGAAFQAVHRAEVFENGFGRSVPVHGRLVPAAGADSRPFAWLDSGRKPNNVDKEDVVVVAPGAVRARLLVPVRAGGPLVRVADVTLDADGVGVITRRPSDPPFEPAVVQAYAADGTALAPVPVQGAHDDDPMDDWPDEGSR
jgi:hypothetical protein